MSPQKAAPPIADLPVGGHVKRLEGLVWRRRVDWQPPDYRFIADQYRKLARDFAAVADAVDEDRLRRYGKDE